MDTAELPYSNKHVAGNGFNSNDSEFLHVQNLNKMRHVYLKQDSEAKLGTEKRSSEKPPAMLADSAEALREFADYQTFVSRQKAAAQQEINTRSK